MPIPLSYPKEQDRARRRFLCHGEQDTTEGWGVILIGADARQLGLPETLLASNPLAGQTEPGRAHDWGVWGAGFGIGSRLVGPFPARLLPRPGLPPDIAEW